MITDEGLSTGDKFFTVLSRLTLFRVFILVSGRSWQVPLVA